MRTIALLLVLGGAGGCSALLPLASVQDDTGRDGSRADATNDVAPPGDRGVVDAGRDLSPADGAPDAAVPDLMQQPDMAGQPDVAQQPDIVTWPDSKPWPDSAPWPDSKPWPDSAPWPDVVQPDASGSPPLILATVDNTLHVFAINGAPQQAAIPIPYGTMSRPFGEDARDLVSLGAGKVAVYNGTFSPYLSVYDPLGTKAWVHNTYQGWSTVANVSYGGLAAWSGFVYATDTATAGAAEAGIVRFPVGTWSATRHGSADYIDVTLGLDNKLYALQYNYKSVDVFDPQTMTQGASATLPFLNVRAVAVNAKGEIFAATWSGEIHHIANGMVINTLNTGYQGLMDIDLADGVLVASSAYGAVVVTDEALSAPGSFTLAGSPAIFVALVPGS